MAARVLGARPLSLPCASRTSPSTGPFAGPIAVESVVGIQKLLDGRFGPEQRVIAELRKQLLCLVSSGLADHRFDLTDRVACSRSRPPLWSRPCRPLSESPAIVVAGPCRAPGRASRHGCHPPSRRATRGGRVGAEHDSGSAAIVVISLPRWNVVACSRYTTLERPGRSHLRRRERLRERAFAQAPVTRPFRPSCERTAPCTHGPDRRPHPPHHGGGRRQPRWPADAPGGQQPPATRPLRNVMPDELHPSFWRA